jgi:predicted nucleotidyltransferase
MSNLPITESPDIPLEKIVALCKRWNIERIELFGPLTNGTEKVPHVDVMLTYDVFTGKQHGLYDLTELWEDLQALFGKEVYFVERQVVERDTNTYFRDAVLGSARTLYATR